MRLTQLWLRVILWYINICQSFALGCSSWFFFNSDNMPATQAGAKNVAWVLHHKENRSFLRFPVSISRQERQFWMTQQNFAHDKVFFKWTHKAKASGTAGAKDYGKCYESNVLARQLDRWNFKFEFFHIHLEHLQGLQLTFWLASQGGGETKKIHQPSIFLFLMASGVLCHIPLSTCYLLLIAIMLNTNIKRRSQQTLNSIDQLKIKIYKMLNNFYEL